MGQAPQPTHSVLPVSALSGRKEHRFSLSLDEKQRKAIIAELDLLGLRKLSFEGKLRAAGRDDWVLEASLGATAVQPCSVSLEPVTTRIDTPVVRRFVAKLPEPDANAGDEDGVPILEDDTLEPLGRDIDLVAVLTEALALALPDYPRAEGVDLGDAVFTEPGKDAMTDEDAKPFAGLASLKDKLTSKKED